MHEIFRFERIDQNLSHRRRIGQFQAKFFFKKTTLPNKQTKKTRIFCNRTFDIEQYDNVTIDFFDIFLDLRLVPLCAEAFLNEINYGFKIQLQVGD